MSRVGLYTRWRTSKGKDGEAAKIGAEDVVSVLREVDDDLNIGRVLAEESVFHGWPTLEEAVVYADAANLVPLTRHP